MPNPTPSPLPVILVGGLPEWLTGVVIPIAAAVIAALIVVAGLAIEAGHRDRLRRATFVDELSQLLIFSANAFREHGGSEQSIMRDGMAANLYRVRAVAQMKRGELRVYDFASRQAREVLNGEESAPQGATALAITHLLEWLSGTRKTRHFPKPGPADTVTVSDESKDDVA